MNYLTRRLSRSHALSILFILLLSLLPARGDFLWFKTPEKAKVTAPSQLVTGQVPAVINKDAYDKLTPENISIVVSLSRQRLYVRAGDQVAIDSPVSSGKRARPTPTGTFPILQKDPDHHSNVYGNYVDSHGRVVRAGVSALIDSAPSGSHFEGAPMTWFMRLTWEGVGMHVGILPGYAASHGCIRLPSEVAHDLYAKVNVGTVVRVEN
jgi:lipoprotein-anchoring transpeptidase ErfK/SrfK